MKKICDSAIIFPQEFDFINNLQIFYGNLKNFTILPFKNNRGLLKCDTSNLGYFNVYVY